MTKGKPVKPEPKVIMQARVTRAFRDAFKSYAYGKGMTVEQFIVACFEARQQADAAEDKTHKH